MGQRRFAMLLAVVSACPIIACQLLVGVRDEVGTAADAGASSIDATAEPAETGPACPLLHPPLMPESSMGTDQPESVFAFQTLRIRPKDAPVLGYDLDERCTKDVAQPQGCIAPGSPDNPPLDDEGGVDNAFGKVVDFFVGSAAGDAGTDPAAKPFNNDILAGRGTTVAFLAGYNGLADDDDVFFDFLRAAGPVTNGCEDASPGDAGRPSWDGCDVWSIAAEDISGGAVPARPLLRLRGYVRGGVMVVRYNDLTVPLGDIGLHLVDAIVTARVSREDGALALRDGTIAGRAPAADLARAALRFTLTNIPVCTSEATSQAVITSVCGARDIRASTMGSEGLPCDSVSVAVGFDALGIRDVVRGRIPTDAGCPEYDATCP
jgi:hypothetical protein